MGDNMKISASEWVLGDRPTALRRAKAAGFDAIELDGALGVDLGKLRDDLAEAQLDVPSVCWAWNSEHELGSPDATSRTAAQRYLLGALEHARDLGASQLVVIPACRNTPWTDEPRIRGIERAAAAISEVLPDAPSEISLALEGLRKIESFLMNTLDEAAELQAMIGDSRVGLLADVYHMVHEEQDPLLALDRHAASITLVHLAAKERGPLLAATPGVDALAARLRVLPAVRSQTLEFVVGDDDALLAESLRFAKSI
jgi:sugar phosphate isomerase/epimerase